MEAMGLQAKKLRCAQIVSIVSFSVKAWAQMQLISVWGAILLLMMLKALKFSRLQMIRQHSLETVLSVFAH